MEEEKGQPAGGTSLCRHDCLERGRAHLSSLLPVAHHLEDRLLDRRRHHRRLVVAVLGRGGRRRVGGGSSSWAAGGRASGSAQVVREEVERERTLNRVETKRHRASQSEWRRATSRSSRGGEDRTLPRTSM